MELWAKSNGETLYEHSILTYEYGIKIIESLPYSKEERKELLTLSSIPLLFHDIGKAACGFQKALREGGNWKGFRHEILSSFFLEQIGLSEIQNFAVITHHRDIEGSSSKKTLPSEQIDQVDGDTGPLQNMKKQFFSNYYDLKDLSARLLLYAGIKKKVDLKEVEGIGIGDAWLIGLYSAAYGQMSEIKYDDRVKALKLRAIIKAADHLASAHIPPVGNTDIKSFKITSYEVRAFQKKCQQSKRNILLTAPTGSGKTEAVLLWAQNNSKNNSRLFYVLPFQASINAMHKRLEQVFSSANVGLLHANAVSYLYKLQGDDEDNILAQEKAIEIAKLAKEIYYPIRVCTPHQLMRFGLKGAGWEFLFIEFSNSLVIYDEIHAYQPRITGLTLSTAKFIQSLGAKIAFASATFPNFIKRLIKEKLDDIEEISPSKDEESDRHILDTKRHIIEVIDGCILDHIDKIKDQIDKGKFVLIICNHVKTAQKVYNELRNCNPMLLHSRFNKKDRRKKEESLMSAAKPKVVIATQVIEVSLDIDYEVMFTEPAPIDALTQRFGRINRKGLRIPEKIIVFNKQYSKNQLYNKERVDKTIENLRYIDNPVSELDLLNITNLVYSEGYSEEEMIEFNQGYNNEDMLEFEKNLIAGVSRDWVSDLMDKIDGSIEVIPIQYLPEYEDLLSRGLWVEANDLKVNVRYSMIMENLSVIDGKYIANCNYNSEIGLQCDEKPSNFDAD